jgi:hypothetical protein
MRIPGRLHIHWADDNTLQIDTDSGTQTRILHFDSSVPSDFQATWQGYSNASWAGVNMGRAGRTPGPNGNLGVVTTKMKAGYLRKNGAPYSASATITEYYDRLKYPNGDSWLIVRTVVEDPTYLTMPFITSTNFKLEANDSKFKPSPCAIDPPVERGEAVFSSDRILR